MEPTVDISAKIRELREKAKGGAGLSQTALASAVGTTPNTVSRWESGTYKPKVEDLHKIAKALNVSILEFFPTQGAPNNESLVTFFRASKELDPRDVEEIRRFAEFRMAEKEMKRPRSGRKRKIPDA